MMRGRSCARRARTNYDTAQNWVRAKLACERHATPGSHWIEFGEFCPAGPVGFFILKVKTGKQREYLYEGMPEGVWAGFKSAPSAGSFYNREIRGRYRFAFGTASAECLERGLR